ncbi:type III restriction/modification enzyme, methylase subunit [Campylobacter hyointestinalis]|nr:type III restriction/modification enzyme, methylase subunit [Campylobacter hyointestinalis]
MLKNKPNLLIKGNNLIALHTLKEYFRHQSEQNKVKLIYIDPPYNTGSDSFNYNDRFNHSTYLTFMKNRLEIARELLRDDGVIFVQCDDNEQAYLKVLMDEIFGRENFVCNLIPLMNPRGRQESAYPIAKSHEYILCYSKKEDAATFFNFGITKNEEISDEIRLLSLRKSGNASLRKDRPNMFYPIFYNTKTNLIYTKQTNDEFEIAIYPIKTNGDEGRWRWQKSNVENNIDLLVCKKNSKDEYDIYVKDYIIKDGQTRGEKTKTFVIDKNIINDKAKEHLEQLFNNKEGFSYPKSEFLLQRIIEISTNENDLVLDFFAGSGTTLAVAHKMKRRYIGIEQMDYIKSITKERLKKVIEGEQGGISKAVSWSGGGNLIYCELASLNAKFIEKIENSSDENELNQIYENLQKLAFIDYRVDIKNDLKDMEFSNLDFIDKKRILKKCLDRNMDYIPYADMDDSEYKIDEQTRILNDIFYKGGNDE